MLMTETIAKCSMCGRDTPWDDSLDCPPLCVGCWDRAVEKYNPLAARQKAYYESHREEVAARQKAYRESHREEVAAWKKKYRRAKTE